MHFILLPFLYVNNDFVVYLVLDFVVYFTGKKKKLFMEGGGGFGAGKKLNQNTNNSPWKGCKHPRILEGS
jgi:hypothetical protein